MKTFHSKWLPIMGLLLIGFVQVRAQTQPPIPGPDNRYKADILVIVAHPDDDTAVSTYLAKAVFDQGKRVAVIFTTRGNSGPNAVGMEQSKALADVREMEGRQSLAAALRMSGSCKARTHLPRMCCIRWKLWDTAALEEVVRIIRLTRPEVILTWMPAYVAGENHGDHQASSVIAVEGFDLAGNPTAFPEQVTPPRQHWGIGNYGEGLHPWQVKKIYFFSDASHPNFLKDHGPTYLASGISRTKKVPFSEITRQAWEQYATQVESNEETMRYYINMPEYLILGKSLVPSSTTADVWAGIDDKPARFQSTPGYKERAGSGLTLTLGGPWAFYREFYPAHGLTSMETLVPPQSALSESRQLWAPLLLRNDSRVAADITLHADLPAGWTGDTKDTVYHLEPGDSYSVQIFLAVPADSTGGRRKS